jgi:hypothetical protein
MSLTAETFMYKEEILKKKRKRRGAFVSPFSGVSVRNWLYLAWWKHFRQFYVREEARADRTCFAVRNTEHHWSSAFKNTSSSILKEFLWNSMNWWSRSIFNFFYRWDYLNSHVNSQNNRSWPAENPLSPDVPKSTTTFNMKEGWILVTQFGYVSRMILEINGY